MCLPCAEAGLPGSGCERAATGITPHALLLGHGAASWQLLLPQELQVSLLLPCTVAWGAAAAAVRCGNTNTCMRSNLEQIYALRHEKTSHNVQLIRKLMLHC